MNFPSLPWERLDERSPISFRMAAIAARDIAEGRSEPGAWLTEADLAAAAGASRTPAREAMLELERWGLIRLLPKKGALVNAVDRAERRDLLNLRAIFETSAVESTASEPERLEQLGRELDVTLRHQEDALAAGDLLGFAGGDFAFHSRIILSAGNSVVAQILDDLGPRLARLTYIAVTGSPSRVATLLEEHGELARRARRGDVGGFAAMVREHIDAGHFSLMAVE